MNRILVIARHKPAEALRVAAGLSLSNDKLRVISLGQLPDTEAVREQLEVVEFIEIPCAEVTDTARQPAELARALVDAEVVYML